MGATFRSSSSQSLPLVVISLGYFLRATKVYTTAQGMAGHQHTLHHSGPGITSFTASCTKLALARKKSIDGRREFLEDRRRRIGKGEAGTRMKAIRSVRLKISMGTVGVSGAMPACYSAD